MGIPLKKLPHTFANAAMGTWFLPMGLSLPDVDGDEWTRVLHRRLTNYADIRALSQSRVLTTAVLKQIARIGELPNIRSNEQERTGVEFFNDKARGLKEPTRSIMFLGSGIDRNRVCSAGERDLDAYQRAQLNMRPDSWEEGVGKLSQIVEREGMVDTCAYLYQSTTRSSLFSRSWFSRLQDAYILNTNPMYVSPQAQEFVDQVYIPLVSKTEKSGTIHRIDTEEARANMRFTLAGQSYGGTFIQMTINSLNEKLLQLHYNPQDIQRIFDNMFVLNISGANFAKDRLNNPHPPSIFIEHMYDFIGFQTDRHDVHPYFNSNIRAGEPIKLSDRRYFYWLDFNWQSLDNPEGVMAPEIDSYGYHDPRAVLQAVPERVRDVLRASLATQGEGFDFQMLMQ